MADLWLGKDLQNQNVKKNIAHILFKFKQWTPIPITNENTSQLKKHRVEFRHTDIVGDPRNRKRIEEYPPEIRD